MNWEKLAHSLRLRFGTSGAEPTAPQLQQIAAEIDRLRQIGKKPTDTDWREAVHHYCPSAGKYKYASIDNSDLNGILDQIINDLNNPKRQP